MEWIALALICPITMGLMMLFMMRGMRHGHGSEPKASGEHGSPALAAERGRTPMPRYVRNLRPDPVTVWAGGGKVKLGARGAPGDTVALPTSAFSDPDLLGCIDFGWIEEVDAASLSLTAMPSLTNGVRAPSAPR